PPPIAHISHLLSCTPLFINYIDSFLYDKTSHIVKPCTKLADKTLQTKKGMFPSQMETSPLI
ncbi:MAG: hypothetical protein Q8M34_11275, partial [Thermodesulfovibrionales bacterium]|nr:hypothetical protein [Thermodesulfovibrionales bacterium]